MRLATDRKISGIVCISLRVWLTPKVWTKLVYTNLWRYHATMYHERPFVRCYIPLMTNHSENISTAMAAVNGSIGA